MTVLREGELTLTLPAGIQGRHFDDESRGVSQMHAVDWIVHCPAQTLFIEVKDIQSRKVRKYNNRDEFAKRFQSGELIPNLVRKFRDSFLYEWACMHSVDSVSYFVVVDGVKRALLLQQTDRLKGELPEGRPTPWRRPLAHRCAIFDINKWNQTFPALPLARDP